MQHLPVSRWFVYAGLAIGGLALDLWTKHVMFAWPELRQGQVHWLIDGYAGFQLSLNEGALFGMGQGAQFWFGLLSVLAAVAIPIWLFRYRAAEDLWMTATLGCVTGGVLGNLYDRANFHGLVWGRDWPLRGSHAQGDAVYAVRDWILLQWSDDLRWPNFNVADVLLVVGAATIFLIAMTASEPPSREHATDQD